MTTLTEGDKMYLLIYEDGEIKFADHVEESWLATVDDGLGQIVRIDGDRPMEYWDGEWHLVEKV